MRKHPVGSKVLFVPVGEPSQTVTVLRHGYDSFGLYTEIQFSNGETERVHRSTLKKIE